MAKKEVVKGRIEETKHQLTGIEEKISNHHSKAKELQTKAYQLRVNHQGDVTKLKQANDLDELVKSHLEIADNLRSDERFIVTRELDELIEKARLFKGNISHFIKVKERFETKKEQLKQEYKRKSEDIDHDLENVAWQLEQAKTLLSELEGDE